jgi:hypothetical protein
MRPPEVAVVAVAALLLVAAAAAAESAAPLPAALRLERAVPHKGVALEELKRRDAARHRVSRRRLLGGVAGVVDFPVEGSANPYMVGWVSCRLRFSSLLSGGGFGSVGVWSAVCDPWNRGKFEPFAVFFCFVG